MDIRPARAGSLWRCIKHMNKMIAILMTIAVAGLVVAGCNSSDNAGTTDNTAPANNAEMKAPDNSKM